MNDIRTLALMLSLFTLTHVPAAIACEMAGPNTHIGVVTAVGDKSLSLKDAESGMNLTFVATPELLKGLATNDRVTVVFTPEGKTLVAKSIRKG